MDESETNAAAALFVLALYVSSLSRSAQARRKQQEGEALYKLEQKL